MTKDYRLIQGDILEVAEGLDLCSIDLVVTSPPYADQRKAQYGGIREKDYPAWTASWMEAVWPLLKREASVLINIRPHIKNGEISDYVLKTRLLLRDLGWVENEELIWIKPDGPPLGSPLRPRRSWESIHWFSRIAEPYCDATAGGLPSDKVGLTGGGRGIGEYVADPGETRSGTSRNRDFIQVGMSTITREKYLDHPAMYPVGVPMWLIAMLCPPEGTVLDPFNGSGTTGEAALRLNRRYIGTDLDAKYIEMSERRLSGWANMGSLF